MLEAVTLTAMLTWGTETLDTPQFGEIEADINQQTIMFDYENYIVGFQQLSINPEVANKMTEENLLIGYRWNPSLAALFGDKTWGVMFAYPILNDFYFNASYFDREKVDRATVGVGYQFTDNISMQVNYGLSDYATGVDGNFTAATLVIKY